MHNILKVIRATIIKLIVACFFVLICILAYKVTIKTKVETAVTFINMLASRNIEYKTLNPVLEENILIHRPIYGSKYATLKIPSINVDLPVYFGESLSLLKYGIGHDSSTYFPGEGGTIVYMGHNFSSFLAKLPDVKIGEKIEVETSYGTFEYTVYDTKIVDETNTASVQIQDEEERLVIYTCWPINNIGHASQRYLVFAR